MSRENQDYSRNIEYQRRMMVLERPENICGSDAVAFKSRVSRIWTRDGSLPFSKQFLYKIVKDGKEVALYDELVILAKYEKAVVLSVRSKNGTMHGYDVVLYLDDFTAEICAADAEDKWAVSLPRANMMI